MDIHILRMVTVACMELLAYYHHPHLFLEGATWQQLLVVESHSKAMEVHCYLHQLQQILQQLQLAFCHSTLLQLVC